MQLASPYRALGAARFVLCLWLLMLAAAGSGTSLQVPMSKQALAATEALSEVQAGTRETGDPKAGLHLPAAGADDLGSFMPAAQVVMALRRPTPTMDSPVSRLEVRQARSSRARWPPAS